MYNTFSFWKKMFDNDSCKNILNLKYKSILIFLGDENFKIPT